jgi:hypothetical protein
LLFNSVLSLAANSALGDEFGDIKLVRSVPLTPVELKAAYGSSKNTCEQIEQGNPIELTSFTPFLTNKDKGASRRLSTRRSFLSIGLEIDQAGLPTLSKSSILDYVDKHYLTVQARIRKDLLDRKLYFHHRPLALTAQFNGPKLSKAFEPVVAQNANLIRSLGVFVEPEIRLLKAEHLRTLVMAFRTERVGISNRSREEYELAIIRGRESTDGANLVPHVFVTIDNCNRLAHLREFSPPKSKRDCSITGKVKITEFDSTSGLYPKKSVTQGYSLAQKSEFTLLELETYCKKNYDGPLSTKINQLLDDIIDGKLANDSLNIDDKFSPVLKP